MANLLLTSSSSSSSSIKRPWLCVCLCLSIIFSETTSILVFQPSSYLFVTGPTLTTFLLGDIADISLYVRSVSPSNTTGNISSPSCLSELTEWTLTKEVIGKSAVRVLLRLNRSLRLCGDNETYGDCCPKPLCVVETLQLSACLGSTPQASLLIQAEIYALLVPTYPLADNKTFIPNQVYQPLGSCPCDLSPRTCEIRCCCDKDCSPKYLKLFQSSCFPGPFGGDVSPTPDYQCIVQSSENSPDWFPFLCVQSPLENNPYLGLFYQGETIVPKAGPSLQSPGLTAPLATNGYRQGSPILTLNDQYFTVPQNSLIGQCVDNAPVAFLTNFNVQCATILRSCPNGPPLQTASTDLRIQVKNGHGGVVTVDVNDVVIINLSQFVSNTAPDTSPGEVQVCENVTLGLDYKFFWKGNGITNITLSRTVGNIILNSSVAVTTRYSSLFLNGNVMAEENSGKPGYLVGWPVIAGFVDTLENNTRITERTTISLWQPVRDGLCSTAEMRPILFGENSTSGCLLPVSLQNLTQCNFLRKTVYALQAALITATHVAKIGNPSVLIMPNWLNISFVTLNSSNSPEDLNSSCTSIPSHQHILISSIITSVIKGVPQWEINSLQVSYSLTTWKWECGGSDSSTCMKLTGTLSFPITSSVTFIDVPINTGPPTTRFQINFTEYDCNRNDVCWPELAFPFTRYYTGETYSQSLAKGLLLVFFVITASLLGNPWRQIRQIWSRTTI